MKYTAVCFLTLFILESASISFFNQRPSKKISISSAASRRDVLKWSTGSILGGGFLLGQPIPAIAVKERNEALCGTGFFTNIWEYRCTDLGDISDEGMTGTLSPTQETSTNSLMSRLGIADSVDETDRDATSAEANTKLKKKQAVPKVSETKTKGM
mmetsp:Transcript_4825/g.10207  ORF Transcript_4825/g.10207 Transcript_4825/m.10207 type:complete len:156 (-) Transcript_4825:46-513(-)